MEAEFIALSSAMRDFLPDSYFLKLVKPSRSKFQRELSSSLLSLRITMVVFNWLLFLK
jgi:hypothetical protein